MTNTRMTDERLALAEGLAAVDKHPDGSDALQVSHRDLLAEVKRLRAPTGSPMDREELVDLRARVKPCIDGTTDAFPIFGWGDLAPVIADRDHHETVADLLKVELLGVRAELKRVQDDALRWRLSCPLDWDSVEDRGVTTAQATKWMRDRGLDTKDRPYDGDEPGAWCVTRGEEVHPYFDSDGLADTIMWIASLPGMPDQWTILDEMAAMPEVSP